MAARSSLGSHDRKLRYRALLDDLSTLGVLRMEPRIRASPEQFHALIEFMERHGDLGRPQSGAQGRLRSDKMWQQLATLLNSIGGGVERTVDKWKKVWADWKTKSKKKHLIMRRHATGTGGGPSSRLTLTALEERVVAVMGASAVHGQAGIQEQGLDRPSTSQSNRVQEIDLHDPIIFEEENVNNVQLIDKTENAVREAQSLLAEGGVEERVKHPGEGYLDSRVLRATSDLAVRCSEAVSGNANTYDRHELAQHIRENPEFWDFPFPREVPPFAYLFGTFAPTPPEQRQRAARRRVEKQQVGALKAPETVDKLEKVEEGSEMVSRVNRFVQKAYRTNSKPLSYFHLVLDPDSFARTVENVYNVSFLVRDGMLAVQIDEDTGLPFVTPLSGSGDGDRAENQFIVSIDMHRWQELIEAFDIQKPMMVLKRR